MIAGDIPFHRDYEICSGQIRWRREVPEQCKDLIHKCLELDPEKRPTLEEILTHPWMNGEIRPLTAEDLAVKKIEKKNQAEPVPQTLPKPQNRAVKRTHEDEIHEGCAPNEIFPAEVEDDVDLGSCQVASPMSPPPPKTDIDSGHHSGDHSHCVTPQPPPQQTPRRWPFSWMFAAAEESTSQPKSTPQHCSCCCVHTHQHHHHNGYFYHTNPSSDNNLSSAELFEGAPTIELSHPGTTSVSPIRIKDIETDSGFVSKNPSNGEFWNFVKMRILEKIQN